MREKLWAIASALLLVIVLPAAAANHLLAPGDIDGDGDVDLVRIEDDGTAHVVDRNGSSYTFQTMDPDRQDLIDLGYEPGTPNVFGVAYLPDTNGNGSSEILVYGHDSWSWLFTGSGPWQALEAWDPATMTRLWAHGTSIPVVPELIWDQTGDGIADVAGRDARTRFPWIHGMIDSVTGIDQSFPAAQKFAFSWRFESAQTLYSAHGLGILGEGKDGAGDMIEFRSTDTRDITHKIWLGKGYEVHQARALASLNDNESRDWAVLRTSGEGQAQRTSVAIRDGRTALRIRDVEYVGWADPLKLMVVNDTDLAVVSRFEGGAQPLEVRDARTGAQRLRVWFPKSLHIESITRTPDMNGNGSHEVGVIGEWPDGTHSILVRDTRTGAWVSRIWFPD